MASRMDWADRPLWVRIGLFGVPSRRAALRWMKGSLVGCIAFMIAMALAAVWLLGVHMAGVVSALGFALVVGSLALVAPLWYWLAIQWVDEHDGWERLAQKF